ncbi:MAG TPA: exonuclease SbcCD subunit D [Firmicutes bacterium]|nr:exonuclease SbcCD subunit D [Bacillota bacterium]
MAIPFIHLADVHLGRLSGAGLTGAQLKQRRVDALEALRRSLEYARTHKVPLVLIAGDLFEHAVVPRSTVLEVRDLLGALSPAQVFIAAGNHDFGAADSFYRTLPWPDNVHLFLGNWETVEVPDLPVTVVGLGFHAPEVTEPHLRALRLEERDEGHYRVVLLHGEMINGGMTMGAPKGSATEAPGGAAAGPGSRYLPVTEADIRECGADYIAMGHIHRPLVRWAGDLAWGDGCRVGEGGYGEGKSEEKRLVKAAYAGALEPLDFGDQGEHGFYHGELTGGGARLVFVPAACRSFHTVTLDISGCETTAGVLEKMAEALKPIKDGDLVRLIFTGEVEPHSEWDRPRLLALGQRFFSFQTIDLTVPAYDLKELAKGYSARAAFVRRLLARLEEAAAEDRIILQRALRLGLDALSGREVKVE